MNTPAKLVLTHGTSDLQILLRDANGQTWRAAPDKSCVRRFHQWLLDNAHCATVVDLPATRQDRAYEALLTKWDANPPHPALGFTLRSGNTCLNAEPLYDENHLLQLVLPKIAPALNAWLAQPNPGLSDVLVLSTDRKHANEQEPIATYTFLRKWLEDKHTVAAANIQETQYLCGDELLESADSPVAPAIAQRIETAMAQFYGAGSGPLLIGAMGGLPPIKPLLNEIAGLLTNDNAVNLFKPERSLAGQQSHSPLDTVRVRRQCLALVRRGALLDAWAMATPFHHDPQAAIWVRPLEQAAQLLNGNPVGDQAANTFPALHALLDAAQHAACLLVAIRVETALLNERWLEAINGSQTFLETAFLDAIQRWAEARQAEYQPRKRYIRFQQQPNPELHKHKHKALSAWQRKSTRDPLAYCVNAVGEQELKAWGKELDRQPLCQLDQCFRKPISLTESNHTPKPSQYRNYNTHSVLSQAEIQQARACFIGATLWSEQINPAASQRPQPGHCFLNQPKVSAVIHDLIGGSLGTSPLALYQDLLAQLEAHLRTPTALATS
ncbi:MAG: hypothetical protein RI925_100 [Pseudomonadota bacterium]|jgi:hypothetical protein